MRLVTRISLVKNCQTRCALAVFRRQQSGEAAAKEVPLPPNSEANQAPSKQIERDPYKKSFASGNTTSGISTHRVWKCAPPTLQTFSQEKFIFTSFNILASELAWKHKFLYSSVQPFHLSWRRRREKILDGLDSCSSDIICLQEVDKFTDVEEDLALRGYVGLYKGRTGDMQDGCAIFWRKNRFQLLQERSFEFSMLGMRNNVAQLCVLQLLIPDVTSTSILSRCNNQLQNHHLVVGNIHVLYNPKRGDIKLGQCRAFLEQVHNMSSIWHGAPVVIGGDFNSTPSSAVYKYLATSELELANLHGTLLSGLVLEELDINAKKSGKERSASGKSSELNANDEETLQEEIRDNADMSIRHTISSLEETCDDTKAAVVSNIELTEMVIADSSSSSDSMTTTEGYSEIVECKHGWDLEDLRVATGKYDCTLVRHELNLSSAYCDIQGCSNTRDAQGEPLLTACHNKFLGTVDYIWRNDGLKTLRVLETLPAEYLARNKGLPIKLWGSDHLPLACELAFTQDNEHITGRSNRQNGSCNV